LSYLSLSSVESCSFDFSPDFFDLSFNFFLPLIRSLPWFAARFRHQRLMGFVCYGVEWRIGRA
jgi:hypothetical protein